jgi:hypothetical protein
LALGYKKMSEITNHWRSDECRIEDGIYFSDDTYIPLESNVPQPPRRPISRLIERDPDNWTIIERNPLTTFSGYAIFGGDATWEGAGFLALAQESNGFLVWLLHSGESEIFRSAKVEKNILIAISGEDGGNSYRWEIPLAEPWLLTVEPLKKLLPK